MAIRDIFDGRAVEDAAKIRDGYVIHEQFYPRVTGILSILAGQHLLSWYAKQTALRAAQLAYLTKNPDGILAMDPGDEEMSESELEVWNFAHERAKFSGTDQDAHRALLNWADNMREPERYRDYRGYIGSVVHHLRYLWALGEETIPTGGQELREYCVFLARKHHTVPDAVVERYQALDRDIYKNIAWDASARWNILRPWLETVRPEYEVNGLETCVYSPSEGYAGTMDGLLVLDRKRFEASGTAWPFGSSTKARVIEDLKTSKSLSKTVGLQLAAYAKAEFIHLRGTLEDYPMPEQIDGLMAVHLDFREARVKPRIWAGAQAIDDLHAAFCHAAQLYRFFDDLPRAVRSRTYREPKPAAPKRGSREVPF